jgi:isoleucyl-tRNA synthetase
MDVDPEGLVCAHPFRTKGVDFEVPLLPGAHVTAEAGTGFVHTAPGHGEEDFELGRVHGLEVPRTIDEEGIFYPDVPLLAGKRILTPEGKDDDANGEVIRELIAANALIAKGTVSIAFSIVIKQMRCSRRGRFATNIPTAGARRLR